MTKSKIGLKKGFTRIVDFRLTKILNIFAGRKTSFSPNRKFTTGFTLIELLVVISIIGFLSSVVLASLNSARSKARDTERLQSMLQLRTALELYKNDKGVYPGEDLSMGSYWTVDGPNSSEDDNYEDGTSPNILNLRSKLVGGKYIADLPKETKAGFNKSYNANPTNYGCGSAGSGSVPYVYCIYTKLDSRK